MSQQRRYRLLERLGVHPTTAEVLGVALDRAFAEAEDVRGARGTCVALDAGCGRASALRRYRDRIGRFVGADIHVPPGGVPGWLDEFDAVDLCGPGDSFPPATFDVILSNFTVEHFAEPEVALRNLRAWLRPGGTLVLATVNRRHPFVAAYLDLPPGVRNRVQPLVKASSADAHPLVGACNDPARIRRALASAGFTDVQVETVGHLARAWGRRWWTFLAGAIGDVAARGFPDRRSTIVASGRVPEGRDARA